MKEFKEFLLKTNALALAVGVIIGGAVGKVVSSIVSDLLMPPIGLLVGNLDFSSLFLNLSTTHYATLEEAKKAGAPTLNYGMFLNNVIDFMIIAFCVYMIEKEFHLGRITHMLTDERVLTAALTNRLHEVTLLLEAGKAINAELELPAVIETILRSATAIVK